MVRRGRVMEGRGGKLTEASRWGRRGHELPNRKVGFLLSTPPGRPVNIKIVQTVYLGMDYDSPRPQGGSGGRHTPSDQALVQVYVFPEAKDPRISAGSYMLRSSASGPDIGLSGRISAGF